jgi:hypothetical protein
VDAADNVVTNVAARYTLICAVAFVFVHDNCTDVEAGVALNEVAAVVGPEIILRPRPNPLTDPPPNVVKNGDISYSVYTINILICFDSGYLSMFHLPV